MKAAPESSDPVAIVVEDAQRVVDSVGQYIDAAQM